MTTSSQMQKVTDLLSSLNSGKAFLVANSSSASYIGTVTKLQKYDIFVLTRSSDHPHFNDDELFHKIKPTVIHTAHLQSAEARDELDSHLTELYPQNSINVFVWPANAGTYCTSNCLATARFDASDNQFYGHDVLIIIN